MSCLGQTAQTFGLVDRRELVIARVILEDLRIVGRRLVTVHSVRLHGVDGASVSDSGGGSGRHGVLKLRPEYEQLIPPAFIALLLRGGLQTQRDPRRSWTSPCSMVRLAPYSESVQRITISKTQAQQQERQDWTAHMSFPSLVSSRLS